MVVSYQLALDNTLLLELRNRSLGNSTTKLAMKLVETHTEDHIKRTRK